MRDGRLTPVEPPSGAVGGRPCGQLFLGGVGAGVTLNAVATALGYDLEDAIVRAEGDLDFRGTLGVAREAPVGFSAIRLVFDIRGNLSEDQRANLIKLTERYCVVYQTIKNGPKVSVSMQRV